MLKYNMSTNLAFTKILSGFSVDVSESPDAINIHLQKTSQISLEDELGRQLEFAECAYHVDIDTGVYHLRDLYTGTASTTYEDFELDNKYKSSHRGAIYGKVAMKWNNKVFGVSLSSPPKANDSPQYASSDTGITGGTRFIQPVSQGTVLSSGKIVYDNTNIQVVLERKAVLHVRKNERISVPGFQEHKEGDKIYFNNSRTQGWLILDRLKFDLKNKRTILEGRGVRT